MSADKKTLEQRIALIIRLLGSDKDGEILAAAAALKRTLASAGTDFNGLAHGIENLGKGISNEERKKIWDAAVQHTENRLHGADDFIDSTGKQSHCSASAISSGSILGIISSSTIWPRARCGGTNRPRSSTSTSSPCSSNWVEKSYDRASGRSDCSPVHRDHRRARAPSDQRRRPAG